MLIYLMLKALEGKYKDLVQGLKNLQIGAKEAISSFNEDPSEDLEFLLAEGKIEELVREGRVPLQIGEIGSRDLTEEGEEVGEFIMRPYYQVPPVGFSPEAIENVFQAQGVYAFTFKDGTTKVGATYTVSKEQAEEIEARVDAELAKVGK